MKKIVLALVSLVFEGYWIENTINGKQMFWYAFTFGTLGGFIPAVIFGYKHSNLLSGLNKPLVRVLKFASYSALCFSFFLPAIASYVNRNITVGPKHLFYTSVTEKALGGRSKTTSYLYFTSPHGVTERIEVDHKFFCATSIGQKIQLTLQNGVLGYEVIKLYSHA